MFYLIWLNVARKTKILVTKHYLYSCIFSIFISICLNVPCFFNLVFLLLSMPLPGGQCRIPNRASTAALANSQDCMNDVIFLFLFHFIRIIFSRVRASGKTALELCWPFRFSTYYVVFYLSIMYCLFTMLLSFCGKLENKFDLIDLCLYMSSRYFQANLCKLKKERNKIWHFISWFSLLIFAPKHAVPGFLITVYHIVVLVVLNGRNGKITKYNFSLQY